MITAEPPMSRSYWGNTSPRIPNCSRGIPRAGRSAAQAAKTLFYRNGDMLKDTSRLEPVDGPFSPKVLPMSSE